MNPCQKSHSKLKKQPHKSPFASFQSFGGPGLLDSSHGICMALLLGTLTCFAHEHSRAEHKPRQVYDLTVSQSGGGKAAQSAGMSDTSERYFSQMDVSILFQTFRP